MNREAISGGLALIALCLAFIAASLASDSLAVLITIAAGCLLAIVASVIIK